MSSVRPCVAGLLAAVALVSAGCGGSGGGGKSSDAASLAPKDAGAFVVVDTDQASTQWQNAEALLAKIPGGKTSLDDALAQLGGGKGLDFAKDVAPLLKTALGAFGGSGGSSTTSGLEGLSAFDTVVFAATADGSRTRFAAVVNLG